MYLSLILITLGVALWVGAAPMFLAPLVVFGICNSAHIPMEEAKMRAQFGAVFDDYTRKAPRWV
jgi:protein-S-isoprenylcysteine O-methyltransferase Ste14